MSGRRERIAPCGVCRITSPSISPRNCVNAEFSFNFAMGIDTESVDAAEMRLDRAMIQGRKFLMRTFRAFDLRLTANARTPFVVTGRSVSAFPCFRVFPTFGKHGATRPEQIKKQRHFFRWRVRCLMNRWRRQFQLSSFFQSRDLLLQFQSLRANVRQFRAQFIQWWVSDARIHRVRFNRP